jgi:IPT/TIG domain-containing protein
MRLALEMRLTPVLSLLALPFLCGAGAASLAAQVPVMSKVVPESGKTGSVLKVQGAFLGKTKVDEVYISDHTFDMKVKVLDQTDDSIEFRIPPFAKPGRLQLVVRTAGKEPLILEQPLYITVEEPKETLQATATAPPPANPPPANGTH